MPHGKNSIKSKIFNNNRLIVCFKGMVRKTIQKTCMVLGDMPRGYIEKSEKDAILSLNPETIENYDNAWKLDLFPFINDPCNTIMAVKHKGKLNYGFFYTQNRQYMELEKPRSEQMYRERKLACGLYSSCPSLLKKILPQSNKETLPSSWCISIICEVLNNNLISFEMEQTESFFLGYSPYDGRVKRGFCLGINRECRGRSEEKNKIIFLDINNKEHRELANSLAITFLNSKHIDQKKIAAQKMKDAYKRLWKHNPDAEESPYILSIPECLKNRND